MFDEILTDETKRLKTIIFENGMGVAWLKEANKELLEMNIEEVAQEESKMNTRIAELQAITLPEKEKEDGEERDLKKLNDEQTKELRELTEKTGTLKGKLDAWYGVNNAMKQLYARIKEASWNLDNINYDLTEIVKEGKEFKNEK